MSMSQTFFCVNHDEISLDNTADVIYEGKTYCWKCLQEIKRKSRRRKRRGE